MIQTVNPATGKIEKTFQPNTAFEIEQKVQQAVKGFNVWKKTPLSERIKLTQKLAAHMEAKKTEYAKLATIEMGRPYKDSIKEIEKSIAICTYYAKNAPDFLQDEHVPTEASKSYVHYDPLGILLGIMPWNYPFTQAFRPMIPAILAGNAFILKHASNVPQCSLAIQRMFDECGFPKGVMTSLLIDRQEVGALIADHRIAAVTLTGSEEAGKEVAHYAGNNVKKAVLELGGSDAFIVLEDADIADTVKQAVKARTTNGGQACNSPKRFILHKDIAKEFTDLLLKEVQKLKVGDPFDETTDVGPIAKSELRDLLDRQVQDSLKKGARLLHGGKKLPGDGFYYDITVVDNVKKGMPLFDEEVFGPIISMTTVKNDEEAMTVANDTHLGLSATVWTKDLDRAQQFIQDLHVGLVFINQPVRSDPRLPYGGVKRSGYGRELGKFGIIEFTNIKTVVIK